MVAWHDIIEEYVSEAISSIVSDFHNGIDVIAIKN